MDTVYVVTAYRWGDREKHSYVAGVFDNEEAAIQSAEFENKWRGGKYDCQVIEIPVQSVFVEKNVRDSTLQYKIVHGQDI